MCLTIKDSFLCTNCIIRKTTRRCLRSNCEDYDEAHNNFENPAGRIYIANNEFIIWQIP